MLNRVEIHITEALGVLRSLTSMPKVPWTTKLGDIGEAEIKARLSYFCNVTKLENDVGIDFYCELLEQGTPSSPFYVQAKGTQHFDASWGQGVPKSTIGYWLSQSHPVMLIVFDENTQTCYWMSIERQRYKLLPQMSSSSQTLRISLDRSQVLERGAESNEAFITQIRAGQGSIMLWTGYPQLKGQDYVKELPDAPRSATELARVKENIRIASYSLVRYYTGSSFEWAKAGELCEFLAKFDKSHYNHFVWLAQIKEVQGDRPAALLNWKEALSICERDKTWPKESMDSLKEAIKKEIERIESSSKEG
jgi:hypothetical protein